MKVAAETFWNCTDELLEEGIDKERIEINIMRSLTPFYAMRYVKDDSFLPTDTTLKTEILYNQR